MKKHIKTIAIWTCFLGIGSLIGWKLNSIINNMYLSQPVDYLQIGSPNWFIAVPTFCLLLALIPIGYLLGRKFSDDI